MSPTANKAARGARLARWRSSYRFLVPRAPLSCVLSRSVPGARARSARRVTLCILGGVGHAAHGLRRLDRLDDPHVELALRLYNDPELLGATLERAKLPERAERVAIAIEDPEEGPYVVVTRLGRFVTCLARGMTPGDTPVVTREHLDAAARDVERMREVIAQSKYFDKNRGLLRKKLHDLYDAGPYVSREQLEDVARWEPLFGHSLLAACIATTTDLFEKRALLRNITRPHPKHEAALRRYYESFYACAHLYVLSAISPASRDLLAKLLEDHPDATWTWGGVRHGIAYLLDRAMWATARHGKVLLPGAKRRQRRAVTFLGTIDAMLSLGVIGLGHEKLRAEARKALHAPLIPRDIEPDPRAQPLRVLFRAILDICFDRPGEADAFALSVGGQVLVDNAPHFPERYRFERLEDVPVDLARAVFVNTSDCVLADNDRLANSFWHLPWLVRAEPGELYLPSDFVELIRRPWRMEDSIALLELQRSEQGVRKPRSSDKVAGRNDPCPCGSGNKYKRCCGAK